MKKKFDLQFFCGGTETQQIQKRNPEPDELKNLRQGLYDNVYAGLQSYNAKDWDNARITANNALNQQNSLLSQIPSNLQKTGDITDKILNVSETGNIPSAFTDALNASVNKELQGSMGTMLNNLSSRGVLNSSITSQGTSKLAQQAADAYNRNYLSAVNTVLGGYGSALQGAQNNTASLLGTINALGNIPSQAYEGVAAQLTPAFNLWRAWQNSNDNREDYDTIVTEGSSSCITGDTLVRLADGQEIPVSELEESDQIQAWDFEKGEITSCPLTALFKGKSNDGVDVVRIKFEDGSQVGVIYEHLFFDLTEGKFIAINSDSQEYIGHEFAKVNQEGQIVPVKVKEIFIDGKTDKTYAPQSKGHLNFLASGVISGNDGQLGICNRFDFDCEKMSYDHEKKVQDLEKYGKLDYKEFAGIISREFFEANHIDEFSVAFGKGLMTLGEWKAYLKKFASCFLE